MEVAADGSHTERDAAGVSSTGSTT
jgi:hypothetical protein